MGRLPASVTCGLLLSANDASASPRVTAIDAFHMDEDGKLLTERLDTLAEAPELLQVSVRGDSLLAWRRGTELCAYDCTTFTS